MTIERMIELLKIEHECMLRCAHDDCDRKCADCELVQEDGELHEMYTNVVCLLKEQETVKVEKRKEEAEWNVCSNCGGHLIHKWSYCPYCGRTVKWE